MPIDLSKKGKLEMLTNYYMNFRADYFVYCRFIKDLEITNNFTSETKTQLAGMIRFCQRQFVDSMIVKLAKLVEATLKIGKEKINQQKKQDRKRLVEEIYNLEGQYTKSNLKKIRDKIVAHLDDDFLRSKEGLNKINQNFNVSKNEEYRNLLELVGDLINLLWSLQENTTIEYPEIHFDLVNQLLPMIVSGYKNFYSASKSIGINKEEVDEELENFKLFIEKRVEKYQEYQKIRPKA